MMVGRWREARDNNKVVLTSTLVRPVLMYGCESWSLTKNEGNEINIFERKIQRKIYGPTIMEFGVSDIIKNCTDFIMNQISLKWLKQQD
jgi:hypothetical protein